MDKKSLTVDYREMEKITARDKLDSTKRGAPVPSFLASLTPTQLAEMFPDYYRRDLPDIGKAMSGATPLTGAPGWKQTAVPPMRTRARQSPGVKLSDGSVVPGQDPGALLGPLGIDSSGYKKPQQSPGVKLTWQQALEQGALQKRLQQQGYGPNQKIRTYMKNGHPYVNKQDFYDQAVRTFAKSPLNGYIPQDGEKYGLDGTPQSWANMIMRTTLPESNL